MNLPAEIVQLVLVNASYQDVCKSKMISRHWREAAIDVLRRGAYKKKTLEEKVQFTIFKLKKAAKKSGKKSKILKDDLNKLLTYALDVKVLLDLPAIVTNRKVSDSLIQLWLYAEDEMGLWDYFDQMIANSDKVHIRSALITPYLQRRCHDLYELSFDLLDDIMDKNADLVLEVRNIIIPKSANFAKMDPTKNGRPENAENLIKIFKEYLNVYIPALLEMNRETLAFLQHIYQKFGEPRVIKAILIMNFITPSILLQSSDRDFLGKGKKKSKPDIGRLRKYILICKIWSSAMLGNKHKEDFLSGLDEFTAQVAAQLNDVVTQLMARDVDPTSVFHPLEFSVSDILETLATIKEIDSKSKSATSVQVGK